MGRPRQTLPRPALTNDEIATASYAGSGEHKVTRWWGGLPLAHIGPDGTASRPGRQDTTICRLTTEDDRERATCWVRINGIAGSYKGWPVEEAEKRAVFG